MAPQNSTAAASTAAAGTAAAPSAAKATAKIAAQTTKTAAAPAPAATTSAATAPAPALGHSFFAGFILALIAALCTLGVLFVQHDTQAAINHHRAQQEQELIQSLLPDVISKAAANGQQVTFTCKLITHPLVGRNMHAYIVRNSQQQVLGYIASYSTARGYANPLILIGGFDPQGRLSKIDVQLSHETPGIGDRVERKRGNFLDQFDCKTLADSNWDVKKFGGDFDYITGATVTSRAIVLATRDLLTLMQHTNWNRLPDCSRAY